MSHHSDIWDHLCFIWWVSFVMVLEYSVTMEGNKPLLYHKVFDSLIFIYLQIHQYLCFFLLSNINICIFPWKKTCQPVCTVYVSVGSPSYKIIQFNSPLQAALLSLTLSRCHARPEMIKQWQPHIKDLIHVYARPHSLSLSSHSFFAAASSLAFG